MQYYFSGNFYWAYSGTINVIVVPLSFTESNVMSPPQAAARLFMFPMPVLKTPVCSISNPIPLSVICMLICFSVRLISTKHDDADACFTILCNASLRMRKKFCLNKGEIFISLFTGGKFISHSIPESSKKLLQ